LFDELPDWQCSKCWKKYTFKEFHQLFACFANFKEPEKYGRLFVCTCGAQFHKDKWHLMTFVDEYKISTVHLNLGHGDNVDYTSTKFLFFETMISKEDKFMSFQARYESLEQAIDGHWFVVDNLPKIILNPDIYPMDILGRFGNAIDAAIDQEDVKFRKDNR